MKKINFILVAATAIALLSACSKLTPDNLGKVHNGMTSNEVKLILGDPSDVQTSNMFGVMSGAAYTYKSGSSVVKVSFVNDKVIATEGDFQ